jgi:hypothetical protein
VRSGNGAEDGEEEKVAGAGAAAAAGRHGWGWSEMGRECVREDTAEAGGEVPP